MDRGQYDFFSEKRQEERKDYCLRLLTAWELMEAKREAQGLGKDPDTLGLRNNAAILARAVVQGDRPVFSSPEALLRQWSGERIAEEMTVYRKLSEAAEPDWTDEALIEALRGKLGEDWEARIRWKVLRQFGVLPSEQRARDMTRNDYLYCALQLMLEREEQLDRLCPQCRSQAEENHCSACGRVLYGENGKNPAFDVKRFEELKKHG